MMTSIQQIQAALLAKLTAGKPSTSQALEIMLDDLPEYERSKITRDIIKYAGSIDLSGLCEAELETLDILTADQILTTNWPDPVWTVPEVLPAGLTILAGAPKVGKSWLALQIAHAVAAGSMVFGTQVKRGPIFYLALEDPPRRLKNRMQTQKWRVGLDASFLTLGSFIEQIGDLREGGSERLVRQIERQGSRLVTIDTLSRSIFGRQNEAEEMTQWLAPLQEIAHERNCSILLIDHHRKTGGANPDVIADILGSTAKGAMADTVMGLYRERGKSGARLAITGRENEERTLDLRMDWQLGCWHLEDSGEAVPTQQAKIIDVLENIGPAGVNDIANALDRNRGTIYRQLAALEKKGKVYKNKDKDWAPKT